MTNPSEMYRKLEHKDEHKRKSLLTEFLGDTDWEDDD